MAKSGPKPIPLIDRFMAKVCPEPMSGCWLWEGSTRLGKWNYGQLWVIERQKPSSTHRIAYELFVGPIPDDKIVMHTCDVPICVNPKHLRLGTYQENTLDMYEKGRNRPGDTSGEKNWKAKLRRGDVLTMRSLLKVAPYGTKAKLAELYGVGATAITRMAKGQSWKAV